MDQVCAECVMLQQAAFEVTIRHIRAESSLSIAKLEHDSRKIRDLEPLVESLFQARNVAVLAYQKHVDTHGQKAAQCEV